jgi:hypothetical protein
MKRRVRPVPLPIARVPARCGPVAEERQLLASGTNRRGSPPGRVEPTSRAVPLPGPHYVALSMGGVHPV